jgi:hypothetical protein
MSCHCIGHALNHVQEEILELYEEGRFDTDTARSLLLQCNDALGFCDGNLNEATETFNKSYCSDCLRKVAEGENLYQIYWGKRGYRNIRDYRDKHKLIGFMLCEECFTKMCTSLGMTPEEIEADKLTQNDD